MLGGFFEELGGKGVLVMLGAGAGVSFVHSWVSAKVKDWLKAKHPEYTEADLVYYTEAYTGAGMLAPSLMWMILRLTDKLPSSDTYDVFDNIAGADMLWEAWNGIETIMAKLEA